MSTKHKPTIYNFIKGWNLEQVLGEGTYGEVRLAVSQTGSDMVAVKIIPKKSSKEQTEIINKEILIQKMCKHPNIVQLYGDRQDDRFRYLLLQYASGGELFDRIEPEVGMPESRARRYFKQLLDGTAYLHVKGVVHRDIKPENILLDSKDCLKLTDFGMATVYRHRGTERLLSRSCGTAVYAAPEVLSGDPYSGPPADIWSCAVVLVAMLAGELPWDRASSDNPEYQRWLSGGVGGVAPWLKIGTTALFLLKKLLCRKPSDRLSMEDTQAHRWLFMVDDEGARTDRYDSDDDAVPAFSQPAPIEEPFFIDHSEEGMPTASFSQPIHTADMVLSQVTMTPTSASQTRMQQLVRRMTRFYVTTDLKKTSDNLLQVLGDLGYSHKKNNSAMITVMTVDKRKMELVFKVSLIEMDLWLLEFRRSKGDGIEFKKCFKAIRKCMTPIISKTPAPTQGQVEVILSI